MSFIIYKLWKYLFKKFIPSFSGAVMVVIVWLLDLQLPVQSVHITTKVVSVNTIPWRSVLDTTLCDKVCQWQVGGYQGRIQDFKLGGVNLK